MSNSGYAIPEMAADLRVIIEDSASEREIIEHALPLVEWMSQRGEIWLPAYRFKAESQGGFGVNLLYEEPGTGLAICAIVWPPGGYNSPHEHRCWEIFSPIYGTVRHTNRTPSESRSKARHRDPAKENLITLRPGQAAAAMPQETHELENIGSGPSLTMHVYGCGLAEINPQPAGISGFSEPARQSR